MNDKEKKINIENLVNFKNNETIAEYIIDNQKKYYCIIEDNSTILLSLQDTINRIINAGGNDKDIKRIMGIEKRDGSVSNKDSLHVDSDYYLCGRMNLFIMLDDIEGYKDYCANFCANNNIDLNEIKEQYDERDLVDIYKKISTYVSMRLKKKILDFVTFNRINYNKKKLGDGVSELLGSGKLSENILKDINTFKYKKDYELFYSLITSSLIEKYGYCDLDDICKIDGVVSNPLHVINEKRMRVQNVNKKHQKLIIPMPVVDTINGRYARTPEIVWENNDTLLTLRKPHLLSPEHLRKMKDMPY